MNMGAPYWGSLRDVGPEDGLSGDSGALAS